MSLPTGLYKIAFTYGTDYGVIVLQNNGKLRGGDSAYVGTYEEDGDLLTMQVSVTQHRPTPGVVSVIGFNNMVVELAGMTDDGTLRLRGTSKQVPGVRFEARLSHIAD
ncbi:hypothetical protein HHL08_22600 [Sphingobium sp. AR-3-1]|uniref:Type III secretion system (T3SS) negative regulator GrlR n=1 Tax=Sphingobium psychrophilum TaxID=2728834 RepID=A0A7X9WZP2_9SPHN|nr:MULTISPECIES: hypothetical protein [Sphingobium]AOF94985.1 hypothetical protein BSY17_3260 [Sphingobium sp. RAC03]MBJ7442227.1 hypothetical protein [Sphingopyxis sp.]NML12886.1 hypothetical protein [Sphingobium psychrophilum]WCP15814.1 hypothetical protein sphantq_04302 [Sphingobium sp. AntQ-1]